DGGWPDSPRVYEWRADLVRYQGEAERRLTPSMRPRIDVAGLYADALEQLEPLRHEPVMPLPWPTKCPFTLDQLLNDAWALLQQRLHASSDP
ncbi:MAG TPA: DUF29 family protein, partial [Acetobacteraceae bacterium]